MVLSSATGHRLASELQLRLGKHRTRRLTHSLCRLRYFCRRLRSGRPRVKILAADAIPGQSLYLSGTVDDPNRQILDWELTCRDRGRGNSVKSIGSAIHTFPGRAGPLRDPGRDLGFAALLASPEPGVSRLAPHTAAPRLRLRLSNGRSLNVRLKLSPRPMNVLSRIRAMLNHLPAPWPGKPDLFAQCIAPHIAELWRNRQTECRGLADADQLISYNPGRCASSPAVTLMIPVYGRYDFIEHQLAHFCNDADLAKAQILFIIDDPTIVEAVKRSCDNLARTRAVAFDVLYLARNVGYAEANNRGVQKARGRLILLLNSDVIPAGRPWLSTLIQHHERHPQPLVLGARLLYEDDTVQHEGMFFERSPEANDLWINRHRGKGLPVDLFEQGRTLVKCHAVTGACLMIEKALYLKLGGLDNTYILGDFEDSDFCLRARQAGMHIRTATDVHLYHLERQSQSLVSSEPWKRELTYYNCWQHTQRWNARIIALERAGQP